MSFSSVNFTLMNVSELNGRKARLFAWRLIHSPCALWSFKNLNPFNFSHVDTGGPLFGHKKNYNANFIAAAILRKACEFKADEKNRLLRSDTESVGPNRFY